VASGRVLPRAFQPLPPAPAAFVAGEPAARAAFGEKRITVVADRLTPGSNLEAMVRRFVAACDGTVDVVELAALDVKGGCLGCCNCGFDNECSWDGRDGYRAFYEAKVKPADVLVFAGTMTDRALSALWKTYFDRSFYNTHIPVYRGKQMAWLVAGPLSANANLRQTMEVYPDFTGANLAGIVTDEGDGAAIGLALDGLAVRLAGDLAGAYIRPQTFLGYAAMHLFRDDVFRGMRFIFRADHRWYKKHGVYKSLPHRGRVPRILSALLGPVFAIPAVKRVFKGMIKAKMVEGHAAIVERAGQEG
jgi:multimeric flavodoxin WrbA